jgi:8-oxo-dGTP pyrophosphatase MutT (NUDIX family)
MNDLTKTVPKRRITSCALFFNGEHEILIVKPTYRNDNDWLIVGGTVDENESPLSGCKREVREELGIDLPVQRLLCVEYQPPQDTRPEGLHFIFYGGVLSEPQIQVIKLPVDELCEFRFCRYDDALKLISPRLAERVVFALAALEQQKTIYLENKVEIE